jgi:hypothetical protein
MSIPAALALKAAIEGALLLATPAAGASGDATQAELSLHNDPGGLLLNLDVLRAAVSASASLPVAAAASSRRWCERTPVPARCR